MNFEIRIVDVYELLDALVNCFGGAEDEGREDDPVEIYVFLSTLDVMEEDAGLVDVVDTFFLGDVGEPEVELSVFSHSLLELFLG